MTAQNTNRPGADGPVQPAKSRVPGYKKPAFWMPVLLVLAIVFGAWYSLRGTVSEPSIAAPSHIGDLKRTMVMVGEEALQQMQELHSGDIGIADGYMADYEKGGEKLTLWVGAATTEDDAEQLLERMVAAIAKPGMPFSAPVPATVAMRQVFATSGGGTSNYFFRERRSVVWVMLTNSSMPSSRLVEVLQTVKFE